MRISELFEAQIAGVVPGDKIGETPPGARPTGDYPTPVTQGPPATSNTPKTTSATGFAPGAKSPTMGATPAPQPGSSATTNPPTDPNQPETPQQAAMGDQQQDMAHDLESLKMMLRQMQGQLTPPPPPPN